MLLLLLVFNCIFFTLLILPSFSSSSDSTFASSIISLKMCLFNGVYDRFLLFGTSYVDIALFELILELVIVIGILISCLSKTLDLSFYKEFEFFLSLKKLVLLFSSDDLVELVARLMSLSCYY